MKKRILRLIIGLTIFVTLVNSSGILNRFTRASTAYAVGDLSVNWGVPEGDPIFVVTNMAPGESQSRTVSVTNDAATARMVAVRGIKTSETNALATALDFVISEGATDRYGGTSITGPKTLQDFFDETAGFDGVDLSSLAPSATTSYTFKATFKPGSGNEFQNSQVIFDLMIGISFTTPAECVGLALDGDLIFGTAKNDILRGTPQGDLIIALEGSDIVQGRNGDDCIVGGPGNDILQGENGNDGLIGNEGNDVLQGGSGIDRLHGGIGNDSMVGQDGNDLMFGDAGNDSMTGGNGDDEMHGGGDRDAMHGESGNDVMFGDAGNDALHGGSNNDTINGGTGANSINGGAGIDTCTNGTAITCEL